MLRGVDVTIPAGTNVAVVGETGSGKTTFAKLLCRLADPTRGRILIDGIDLRDVSAGSRFAAIRMVPQDGFLFDASIAENVRMGRPDATDAEVGSAFVRLGLDWWLARLPAGLATEVGERGENLSVGERQLVALARAQLADPGLLILDEATSAVDPETERALADALARAHGRADHDQRGPPAVHGRGRRPGARVRRRRAGREGSPRRAAVRRRSLLHDVRELAGQHPGGLTGGRSIAVAPRPLARFGSVPERRSGRRDRSPRSVAP